MPKTFSEVRRSLRRDGWAIVRRKGSHEVWAHPTKPGRAVVAGKDTKVVPRGTLANIRRATGLETLR